MKLPKTWKIVNIGDIADVKGGKRLPKGHKLLESPKSHPYIRVLDFKKRTVESENIKFLSEETFESIKNYRISSDDVYISIAGTIGLAGLIPTSLNGANLTENAAKLCNLKNIDKKFLVYVLDSNFVKSQVKALTMAVTQPKLALFRIKSLKIPLPPIKTQKKIVEILEKAEEMKEWRIEADELADEYLKSVFNEMFGDPLKNPNNWDVDKLENVCKKINDGTHHSPFNSENGDYPYITAKNIKKNGINLNNITYISKKIHNEIYSRCDPKFGDVLYIKDGVTTGIAVVNDLNFEFSLLSSVALLKMGEKLNPYYLSHLLNSDNMYNRIRYDMGGAAITRLTLVKIKRIKIPVPPIELQNQFAGIVKQVETLKSYQSQSKQEMDNLFNTLIQKAFKGELVC